MIHRWTLRTVETGFQIDGDLSESEFRANSKGLLTEAKVGFQNELK